MTAAAATTTSWRGWTGPSLALVAAILLIQVAAPRATFAQQVTDVRMRFNEMLILDYYPSFETAITDGQIVNKLFRNAGAPLIDHGISTPAAGTTVDAGLAGEVDDPLGLQAVGRMQLGPNFFGDFFAVRSLSASGSTRVIVSLDEAVATHAQGSTLTVTRVIAIVGNQRGGTVTLSAPGLSPVSGSIRMTVDTANARHFGTYSGIRILITAENI